MSRRTKIIIAVIVVLLLIALGIFLYFLFNKKPATPPTNGKFPPPGEEVTPPAETPTVLPETSGVFEPILRQLSKVPIAGAVLGVKGGEAIARYQERATGNIYEIGAAGEGEKRLTHTTVPKVYEALWSKSGTALVSRYAREGTETIESFSAHINSGVSGSEGELAGVFLPRGIPDMAVSPTGNSVFYLQEENGGVSGIRSDLSGNAKTKLWASPVKEWLVSWPVPERIVLLSKPSAFADGMLLSLDPTSDKTSLLLSSIPGLTALLNPARPEILYSESTESGLLLHLLETATAKRRDLPLVTLPEKCAWAKSGEHLYCGVPKTIAPGNYPDVWYQGVVPFTDEVWDITPSPGTVKLVLDVSGKRGIPLDVTNPQVSPDDKFLIFTDKISGTLWSLQMKE